MPCPHLQDYSKGGRHYLSSAEPAARGGSLLADGPFDFGAPAQGLNRTTGPSREFIPICNPVVNREDSQWAGRVAECWYISSTPSG